MTLFILSPLVVLTLLVLLISRSLQTGPAMEGARVGAGAGETGGANALGERLFGESDTEAAPVDEVVPSQNPPEPESTSAEHESSENDPG